MSYLFNKKIKNKIKEDLRLEEAETLNENLVAQQKTFNINTLCS